MHLRIRLIGGTLKIKTAKYLRTAEIYHKFPMVRIGQHFVIWWPSNKNKAR